MRALTLLFAAALCCANVHAQVPHKINYQGYLTNAAGTPVNATVSMALKLYNVVTGGAALYTETQPVTVTNGVFNVLIGSALALPFDVTLVGASQLSGGPVFTVVGTMNCAGVYDEAYAFFASSCPQSGVIAG